jgi:hypothetical protein
LLNVSYGHLSLRARRKEGISPLNVTSGHCGHVFVYNGFDVALLSGDTGNPGIGCKPNQADPNKREHAY